MANHGQDIKLAIKIGVHSSFSLDMERILEEEGFGQELLKHKKVHICKVHNVFLTLKISLLPQKTA